MKTYSEKLKSPQWVSIRELIKSRDENKCALCDNKNGLQVHHLYYENNKQPWDYPEKALITLCSDCHSRFHLAEKIIKANEHLIIISNYYTFMESVGTNKAYLLLLALTEEVRNDAIVPALREGENNAYLFYLNKIDGNNLFYTYSGSVGF